MLTFDTFTSELPLWLPDVLLTDTETSCDNKSRGTTPSQDLEYDGYNKNRVRLSLWLQWTLPKLDTRFYKHDKIMNQGKNRCIVKCLIKYTIQTQRSIFTSILIFVHIFYFNSIENRVTMQIEDIALSVDVQEIYAKVKVTCNSANVHHFVRKITKHKKWVWSS